MKLPVEPPYEPMEARLVDAIPEGEGWQYEPKWDGFRCLVYRDGDEVELQSKSGQPLTRYFPEVVADMKALRAGRFVLDGELVVPVEGKLSFDHLLLRIHPAASRVKRLAREHPAAFIAFDLLVDERRTNLVDQPLARRRERLERFAERFFPKRGPIFLSPMHLSPETAHRWLSSAGVDLDGVVAKRRDLIYRSGERTGMVKVKRLRTADCVVGGFRYASRRRVVGSLLLGLYDDDGLLHHVGYTSTINEAEKKRLTPRLEKLIAPPGFTGRAPGGPSRWSTRRSMEWQPLRPELVVEVRWDHFGGGRFRHGTRLLRFRPDKRPDQCTFEQVAGRGGPTPLELAGAPA